MEPRSQGIHRLSQGRNVSCEGYAQFLRAMGHHVRHVSGIYWFNAHPHVYMSFPFDREIDPSTMDWREVFGGDGWAARFPCDLSMGRHSYRIVADQNHYGLHSLSGKARNQTRRGLDQCDVRPVSFDELQDLGLQLNRETMVRQQRKIDADFDTYWERYYASAAVADGAEAWGAFVEGRLAAYLIAFRMEGVAHILIVRSSSRFLKQYPNNALMFTYLSHTLAADDIREVSIGLESIQEGMGTLDHFKLGMGFRKKPTGQRIVLKPMLENFLGPIGLRAARFVVKNGWGKERMAKLSGLLQWYAEQPRLK